MRSNYKIFDTRRNRINLVVSVNDNASIPETATVSIDASTINIPQNIILEVLDIPEYDYVNEILRCEILLRYLRESNQKALIKDAVNLDKLMSSRWAELFLVKP